MRKITLSIAMLPALAAAQDGGAANLPAPGTEIVAKLSSPISTRGSRKKQPVVAQVIEPESLVNAIIEGQITEATPAHKREKAKIAFGFEKLTIGGKTYPFHAELIKVRNSKGQMDADEEGQIVGKESNRKRIGGTLAGAGIGAAIGALAGGGSGAAAGGAAGAAAGFLLTYSLTTSGSDVEFAPGSNFYLRVSDPKRQQ